MFLNVKCRTCINFTMTKFYNYLANIYVVYYCWIELRDCCTIFDQLSLSLTTERIFSQGEKNHINILPKEDI